jgi:hypothetical protein
MTTGPLGFGHRELPLPGHLCLIHDSYAELRLRQFDFLADALGDPQHGVGLFGAPGVAEHLRRDLEIDLDRSLDDEVRRGKLVLVESDPDPDVYLERVRETLDALSARGYALSRSLGRVSWNVPGFPEPEDQLWFESRLDALIASSQAIVVCAYDLSALPGCALAYGGVETHPQIVLGGQLTDNPSFIEPQRYFTERLLRLPWLTPP